MEREDESDDRERWYWFRRGFVGLVPLWAGAIPSGVAFGVAAREVGLRGWQTQVMSLTVFSAAAQLSATSLWADGGTSTTVMVLTVMALNAHVPLLGLAVGRQARPVGAVRWLAGWVLTDGAFGIALRQGLRLPTLLGAGASMYLSFNAGTAIGATAGVTIPNIKEYGIDMVAPLTFLAVLAPLIRTRVTLLVACVAGGTAFVLAQWIPSGLAVLGAGMAASAVGAWYQPPSVDSGDVR